MCKNVFDLVIFCSKDVGRKYLLKIRRRHAYFEFHYVGVFMPMRSSFSLCSRVVETNRLTNSLGTSIYHLENRQTVKKGSASLEFYGVIAAPI